MNQYRFKDMEIGMAESFSVEITTEMLEQFLSISGDSNPLHTEEEYAKKNGFDARVAYGMLTASFYSTLAGVYLPGKYCLLQEVSTSFHQPVYIGDTLTITGMVKDTNETFERVTISAKITNQNKKRVSKAKIEVGFHGK